ncbi:LETM1-like protein-domain-containing protein [Chytriomyces cf. hyalinus JEL632]|nr:LETM1-like protein-domain-containing protein [Chytriomyces cf. hyalinus JEL632]
MIPSHLARTVAIVRISGQRCASSGPLSPAARILKRATAPNPEPQLGNKPAPDALSAKYASATVVSTDSTMAAPSKSTALSGFSTFFDGIVSLHGATSDCITLLATYWARSERVVRRDSVRMVLRTIQDLKVLLPSVLYLGLPFQTYTLPTVFRVIPGIVPSTFYTQSVLYIKARTVEAKRTERRQKIIEAVSTQVEDLKTSDDKSVNTSALVYKKMMMNPDGISYSDLNSLLCPLFITSMTASAGLAKPSLFTSFINLTFPHALPRPRLLMWADWILKDDFMIRREGVGAMTRFELIEALEERGFTRLSGLSMDEMKQALVAHARFTKSLVDSIVSKRTNEKAFVPSDDYAKVPVISTQLGMTPEELGGVASLLVFARALDARK